MADWSFGNMFTKYFISAALLLAFVHSSFAFLLIGDVDQCESICASTYSSKEMSNQVICQQGCRLMSISDLMALGSGTLNDAQAICLQSCKEAYPGNDAQGACAFGCQAQLPSVESHHKHLDSYYQSQMEISSALSGLHGYYSRMIDCFMDRISHQIGFGWNVRSSGNFGQLTVIISGDGNAEPVVESIVVGAEQKTSSFLETNLASVDRAATPNVKNMQQAESAIIVDRPGDDSQQMVADSDVDWMFCIERTGTSKKLILLVVVVLLTSVVFCVCTGNTAPGQPYWHGAEKLSINGDLDYLKKINKDEFLLSTKPQEPRWIAPPLPAKIPILAV